jgi:hypothetical protein
VETPSGSHKAKGTGWSVNKDNREMDECRDNGRREYYLS